MIRAPFENALQYLGSSLALIGAIWVVLMAYGKENPWIDRVIFADIAICSALAVVVIFRYTPKFTTRIVGVFWLFFGIFVLYIGSQILASGYWGDPTPTYPPDVLAQMTPPAVLPYWWRSLGRSMLAVAGPCILYGYYYWFRYEAEKEP